MDNIHWMRKNKSLRFKLDDVGNFFLVNQWFLFYLIRLGSFLQLELHIMGRKLNFWSHGWNKPMEIFLGLSYIQYGPWATMYAGGNCLHSN